MFCLLTRAFHCWTVWSVFGLLKERFHHILAMMMAQPIDFDCVVFSGCSKHYFLYDWNEHQIRAEIEMDEWRFHLLRLSTSWWSVYFSKWDWFIILSLFIPSFLFFILFYYFCVPLIAHQKSFAAQVLFLLINAPNVYLSIAVGFILFVSLFWKWRKTNKMAVDEMSYLH